MFFSVIVPIYRVEPYLKQCVDSILSQTFRDYELILVDDGSPDNCPAICDAYAAADDRVRVIHKPNGGLVSARKAGIQVASGDYVINIDSDDWIVGDYFETAYGIIEKHHPDIISFAVNFVTDGEARLDREMTEPGLYTGQRIREAIFPYMLLTEDMRHMHYFVWGKVFRRDVILPHQLEVDERISMGEDVSCLIPTYLEADSVFISEHAVYQCRCHNSSMSRKFNANHYDDIRLGVALLRSKATGYNASLGEAIDRYCAFMCFVLLASAAQANSTDAVDRIRVLWCEEFTQSLHRATFTGITGKSRIAISLLKKNRIRTAYSFLKLCSMLKGRN